MSVIMLFVFSSCLIIWCAISFCLCEGCYMKYEMCHTKNSWLLGACVFFDNSLWPHFVLPGESAIHSICLHLSLSCLRNWLGKTAAWEAGCGVGGQGTLAGRPAGCNNSLLTIVIVGRVVVKTLLRDASTIVGEEWKMYKSWMQNIKK